MSHTDTSVNNNIMSMRVQKRDGTFEDVSFDKVLNRVKNLSSNLNVNVWELAQKVCSRIYDGVKTSELDELAAHLCSSMIVEHPDYGTLASRIIISNHQKNTSPSFSETINMLYWNKDNAGEHNPLISKEVYEVVQKHKEKLNSYIDYNRDFEFDYFGFKTLERAYLMKLNGKPVERPQHMFMRVSLGIHVNDVKDALQTYDCMSKKMFIHATPTLFNSGTPRPQNSSCFLLANFDSIDGIFETMKECAMISKYAGGIGMHIHDIRSKNSRIRGTNGTSDGIIPMLRVFNNVARYVNQAGKRNGSIAVYLEPWHADIMQFLDLKKPHGSEEERARDLFYAMWIPDLFMERVKENGKWSLMCPDQCPGLSDVWGDEFKALYEKYETEGKYSKQLNAQEVWFKILEAQIETGTPYLCYKDAANRKSNQQNLGTIKSSNLCVAPETMVLTDKGYYPIKDLCEQSVNVWNGKEFSQTVVKQTGIMQKLITVQLDNGMSLRCTPYHKFYIEYGTRPAQKSRSAIVQAADLRLGMKIIRYDTPMINSTGEKLKYAYTQGLFAAEGTYNKHNQDMKHRCNYKKWEDTDFCKRHQNNVKEYDDESDQCVANSYFDRPMMWLYGEKKKLVKYVDWLYTFNNNSVDRVDLALPLDIKDKYYVPLNADMESKIKWLEGWVDGDGTVVELDGIKNIQVASTNKDFLTQVIYMLQTLGIQSRISSVHKAGNRSMPDGKGGKKEYYCNETFRINIDSESLLKLKTFGFNPKRLVVSDTRAPHHKTNKYTKVSAIVDNNEYDDTYCFNEPKEHKGIFNGILTGQCSEIVEYTSSDEIAVCNLASICLPSYYDPETKSFDHKKLHDMVKVVTKNLNKVIDVNFYPLEKTRVSNLRHRPLGIGVQGLADLFAIMRYPFDSEQAAKLNRDIFETIYHAALEASNDIAKKRHLDREYLLSNRNEFDPPLDSKYPGAYKSFEGSPASKGQLQFDLWNTQVSDDNWNWTALKKSIKEYGIRNSLLLAPMPTASTSQIASFNECFEPFTSNIYKRKTMAGEFIVVNKYLFKDLIERNLWNHDIKNQMIINDGSIQNISQIPQELKDIYKTVWEIKQKVIIDMAADRGIFVCQSQSMNLFVDAPDFKKLSSMHFYAWSKGLKTGLYYLRSKPRAKTQQFTIEPTKAGVSTNVVIETGQTVPCESCSA